MAGERHPAAAIAARDDVDHWVERATVDAAEFAEVRAFNEAIAGMVAAAVRNDADEVLYVHSEDYGGWVLPGGRAEPGEDLTTAAEREVREETGVTATIRTPLLVVEFVTEHGDRRTIAHLVVFEGVADDPTVAEDPGLPEENITEVRWTTTVPEPLADDETVRRVNAAVAERIGLDVG